MRTTVADAIAGVIFLCGAGGLLLYTLSTDYTAGDSIAFNAAWFPALLLSLATGAAAIMVLKAGAQLFGLIRSDGQALDGIVVSRLAIAVLLSAAYLVAFTWLGYWISTLTFLPLFSWIFGYRNTLVVAAITVVFAGLTWFVFTDLLYIQIPAWPDL